MIVPMKRLTLLCMASAAEKSLVALRELKCVHLDASSALSPSAAVASEELAAAENAVRILNKAAEARERSAELASGVSVEFTERELRQVEGILRADARMQELQELAAKLRRTIGEYAPYGDFDPKLAQELMAQGIDLSTVAKLPEVLPAERLSVTEQRLRDTERHLAAITVALAEVHDETARILQAYPAIKDRIAFAAAKDALSSEGEIAWISGWIPQDSVPAVRARAAKEGWGILVREPESGETPPTCVRPPKLFRPVMALFAGLGIAPAYTESDVSVPFMAYFSLFFAMLVGDGGYGAIILALTLWGWRKTKPAEGAPHRPRVVRSWLTLLTVFSLGTVLWGVVSNTWFGASIPVIDTAAIAAPWAKSLACAVNFVFNGASVKWLADPTYNNMMFLCFTIGVTHLMLARIWSGICLINDSTCLAQFGWAGIVLFMYLVTNSIVGIFSGLPQWSYYLLGGALALIFLFTLKPRELKGRAVELGMLPLNIMGALGDIISYVRLFAVGLASVKVAQNFNEMAVNLDLPWYLKVVPMVLILLIGHALNFAMAGLSILVHAVRLNTLEFSNHKGVTWAGYAFSPFKKH